MHAIRAGEGEVFVSAGVECVSPVHRRQLRLAAGHPQPAVRGRASSARTQAADEGAVEWHDPRADGRAAGRLHRDGADRGERRAGSRASAGRSMDHFGVRSQNLAEKAIADGFFAAGDHPGHAARRRGGVRRRRAAPRGHATRRSRSCKPVFRPGRHGDGRQLLPAQRRRRRAGGHVRPTAERARHHARWPASSPPGVSALSPEIMGLGPVEASRQALAPRRHDDRRHRPGGDQRGVRRAGHPVGARARRRSRRS